MVTRPPRRRAHPSRAEMILPLKPASRRHTIERSNLRIVPSCVRPALVRIGDDARALFLRRPPSCVLVGILWEISVPRGSQRSYLMTSAPPQNA
jgi:hypothetical protein